MNGEQLLDAVFGKMTDDEKMDKSEVAKIDGGKRYKFGIHGRMLEGDKHFSASCIGHLEKMLSLDESDLSTMKHVDTLIEGAKIIRVIGTKLASGETVDAQTTKEKSIVGTINSLLKAGVTPDEMIPCRHLNMAQKSGYNSFVINLTINEGETPEEKEVAKYLGDLYSTVFPNLKF
ncbi:hypothetical protein HNP86_001993 [Methanococcus maripaludis]|uniref:Uncharacterized protein n=1 Tax=Methanococcus maripaludis TaxID=39152 RepID=A0A7J9NX56_METMI|nr:hypothetical protein [Methanococcus maripaludis]MBA2851834.1 hypothetical protein [Methanococcus maripaludis]